MSDARARFESAHRLLTAALESRAFPAAVVEVGGADGHRWREAYGRLTYAGDAAPCAADTVFDLASLTKVIGTTSLAMRAVADGRLSLEMRVADVIDQWTGADRRDVTVRRLLDHSSGLPGVCELWRRYSGRDAYRRAIAALPLEYEPGSGSIYSDPGFMLLGFVLEQIDGAGLDRQFAPLQASLGEIGFLPADHLRARIAPTEQDPWRGRLLVGEVHDENAAALGGVAAHAGLFGTAAAVGAFARIVLATFHASTALATPEVMRTFAARSNVPGSSRALGWDTMLPTSSCGTSMSATAIGHTGFTGTSLWIDWQRDLYVVLLTNRVHPTRTNEQLASLRPLLHDAIVEAGEQSRV
jgi:CubicO group peptidase (beta-lactamase class C family)